MSPAPAALVDAIREAPEDDAPRLVCADWFELGRCDPRSK